MMLRYRITEIDRDAGIVRVDWGRFGTMTYPVPRDENGQILEGPDLNRAIRRVLRRRLIPYTEM